MATSAKDWTGKKTSGQKELTLPSGNVCLVGTIDPQDMLTQGLIPNNLLSSVMTAAQEAAGVKPGEVFDDSKANELMAKIIEDPAELAQMMGMVNAIVVNTVIEPAVKAVPKWSHADLLASRCTEEVVGMEMPLLAREEGDWLWVDQVVTSDRMFIFQYAVGGSEDLAPFREELGAVMAPLGDGGEVASASEWNRWHLRSLLGLVLQRYPCVVAGLR